MAEFDISYRRTSRSTDRFQPPRNTGCLTIILVGFLFGAGIVTGIGYLIL